MTISEYIYLEFMTISEYIYLEFMTISEYIYLEFMTISEKDKNLWRINPLLDRSIYHKTNELCGIFF